MVAEPEPMYEMQVGSHTIQFIEPAPTALIVIEKSTIGEEMLLANFDGNATLEQIFN